MEDETLPDIEGMQKFNKQLEGFVEHMQQEHGVDVGPSMDVGVIANRAKERKKADREAKRAEKKSNSRKRKAPSSDDASAIDGRAAAQAGTLKKFKVTELKQLCRDNGLAVSGKKALLIERLEGHFQ